MTRTSDADRQWKAEDGKAKTMAGGRAEADQVFRARPPAQNPAASGVC